MNNATNTATFENVNDFLAAATAAKDPDGHKTARGSEVEFYGTRTFRQAAELAVTGWPEGRERLERLRAELDSRLQQAIAAKAASQEFAVTGDYVDVGRVLSGEPESFGVTVDAEGGRVNTKVVKIVANVSALGAVGEKQIFSVGASIYAAIDLIEALGSRVELWLGSGASGGLGTSNVFVKIKDASQPFEADRLAFYLCHPSSLRRLFFSIEGVAGYPASGTSTASLCVEEDTIVTQEARPEDNTAARRIARAIKVCEECGIRFSEEELAEIVS